MTTRTGRQYWLWVTRPKYYSLEGEDSPSLIPPNSVVWTCGRDTMAGDLVLLYRTAPKSDIAYLLEVASDAFVSWDGEFEGGYVCEAVSQAQFARPLTLREMQEDPILSGGFGPLRAQFRSRVFSLKPEWWEHLRTLIVNRNPQTAPTFKKLERSSISRELLSEREIEQALEKRIAALDPGKGLKLFSNEFPDGTKRSGRQYHAGMGRIDLLCRDRDGFVVVEIKRGLVDKSAIGQILGYMGWVREKLADEDEPVRGIVVGSDFDSQAQYALSVIPILSFRFLDDLNLSS